jgi:hypothetical protein
MKRNLLVCYAFWSSFNDVERRPKGIIIEKRIKENIIKEEGKVQATAI